MSRLYCTATSDKASKGQGGQKYIIIDLNVGNRQVAQIELLYNNDSKHHGTDLDEWVLQYRPEGSDEDRDWTILAQGNVIPEQKGKRQKGDDLDIAFRRVNADER